MSMECLVTGGSGFVGLHLLARLTATGHKTWVLMRRLENVEALKAQVCGLGGNPACIHPVMGDVSLDGLGLSEADRNNVSSARVIFHLAARFSWGLTIEQARAVNVEGALRVARLAVNQRARFMMVGGYMIKNLAHLRKIGIDPENPEKADWPAVYKQVGGYEGSKLESHFRVTRYLEQQQADYVVVHPATVYGHGETGHIVEGQPFEALVRNLVNGKIKAIPGSPRHWLPLVSVDYLVAMIAYLGFDSSISRQQILALDEKTPQLAGLVRKISRALGMKAPRRHLPIGVLRWLLCIPGMETRFATHRESLNFIQTERFDMSGSQRLEVRYQLTHPYMDQTLAKTARYVRDILLAHQ